MPRKERIKLFEIELKLLRSARRNRELPIPSDKLFKRRVREQADRLVSKGGFDAKRSEHVRLVCAIAYEYLFENKHPGRHRKFDDNDDFDLLEHYADYKTKLTGIQRSNIAGVTNSLCHFDETYAAYKTDLKGPGRLKKRFERAWNRLETGKMKTLSQQRLKKRTAVLQRLDARFGRRRRMSKLH